MIAFLSVDLDNCRRFAHVLRVVGSDKTPLKRSLICLTCSEKTGKNAFAAYGEPLQSWGQWLRRRDRDEQEERQRESA